MAGFARIVIENRPMRSPRQDPVELIEVSGLEALRSVGLMAVPPDSGLNSHRGPV
jgi:hypothetical protein